VVGILLGYLTSYLFIDDVGGWRIMYGIAAAPAMVLLAGMVWILTDLRLLAYWLERSSAMKCGYAND
jgi:MFS family permease